jgi:hypothetical protein
VFDRILELIGDVPDFDGFAGVDELIGGIHEIAASRPDVAAVRRVGTSRLGEPLWSLTVRGGPRHVVVFGAVHPNEPVGGWTSLHLARTLVADDALREALGCTWHVVPCIDPDGTRLNEPWFTPPLTMERYGRSFYRPAVDEQVEWTFPFAYKGFFFDRVMPETVALMRLIDETKPLLLCSLHNGEYGGVFYYLTESSARLNEQLAAIPAALGLPLHTGEGEAAFVEQAAPGVFRGITAEAEIDFLEELGLDAELRGGGASSAAYAARYGSVYLASEVPYWSNPDADDHTPLDVSYARLLAERGRSTGEAARVLSEVLESVRADLSVRSPHLRATESFLPHLRSAAAADLVRAELPEHDRPAVVAERFASTATAHSVRVRFGGMLLSALAGEIAVGNGTPAIRAGHARLAGAFTGWAAEAEAEVAARPIPVRALVGVQFGALLATVADLVE